MALLFSGRVGDNVATGQRPKVERGQGWDLWTVMWPWTLA